MILRSSRRRAIKQLRLCGSRKKKKMMMAKFLFALLSLGLIFYALTMPDGWGGFLFIGLVSLAACFMDWKVKNESSSV